MLERNGKIRIASTTSDRDFPAKEITEKIISCALEVHSALGPGLLESIYESALEREFELRSVFYQRQKEISLQYKGKDIGNHRIDYLVEDQVIVELKAVEALNKIQRRNYLPI